MKTAILLSLSLLFSGVSAFANTFLVECSEADYALIERALESETEIDAKPSVLRRLVAMMAHEERPMCSQEKWISINPTPTTHEKFTFIVGYGNNRFEVVITYDKLNDRFTFIGVD